MTLEERAQCILDTCEGSARGAERKRRVRAKALKMLQEVVAETAAMPRDTSKR